MPNIYAIYNYPRNGTDYDKAKTSALTIGGRYKLTNAAVGSFHTDVYLEGYDKPFNSVMFNFVDENGNGIDIVEVPEYQMYRVYQRKET